MEESHAKIFYNALLNATSVVWNGPVSSQQFRSALDKCLEFIKVYNTPNYISDQTHQGYITRDDQQWMTNDIIRNAASHGLKKLAIITKNYPAKDYTEFSALLEKLNIEHEYFARYNEAVTWIQASNEKSSLSR